jgi:hypothetical protein
LRVELNLLLRVLDAGAATAEAKSGEAGGASGGSRRLETFDAALQDLMRVVSLPELRVPRMANG